MNTKRFAGTIITALVTGAGIVAAILYKKNYQQTGRRAFQ